MKQFGLYTKSSKEAIHKISADSLQEAIRIFSEMKKLEEKILTEIFVVRETK